MFYMPRTLNNYDGVYGADDQSSYNASFPIEIYIKSVDVFSGDGNFMSLFGVEIRDQIIFTVAQRVFNEEVEINTGQPRPNEGDLIYFPLNKKCFQIKYVNKFEMFYQLGALQTWEMTCELFEYSNEQMNTGIPEIDMMQDKNSTNVLDWVIIDEDGVEILTEEEEMFVQEHSTVDDVVAAADNSEIQTESADFVDYTAFDPFSEGNF